jgi:benzoyl-CoA 2,3-dioxygenase component B
VTCRLESPDGKGGITGEDVPMLNALNEAMRESYLKDCEIGLKRWNRTIERAGHDLRLTLPSPRFRRSIGVWAGHPVAPDGKLVPKDEYDRHLYDWVPSDEDRAYVKSLMQRVVEPGRMAAWIAPPDRGINNLPVDYEYVKLN